MTSGIFNIAHRGMIRSFPDRTRARVEKLNEYLKGHVLSGDNFVCRHFSTCRESRREYPFYDGQLHHVGKHYDLEVDGRPTRIVVVGQEYGHGPEKVTLAQRSEMIRASANKNFSSRGRNPHMKGTASILRLLLGREPGADRDGEQLGVDARAHIFDGFALVNYLLCSAVKEARQDSSKGGTKGFSSPTMRRNCADHFVQSLKILDPTVIVVEGKGVREWLSPALALPIRGPIVDHVLITGNLVPLLTFDHPSAGGSSGYWGGSPNSRYLREIVAPTIRSFLTNGSLTA